MSDCTCGHEERYHRKQGCIWYAGNESVSKLFFCSCRTYRPLSEQITDADLKDAFSNDWQPSTFDLKNNITRGEEALKGIEPGAVFDIEDLFGRAN